MPCMFTFEIACPKGGDMTVAQPATDEGLTAELLCQTSQSALDGFVLNLAGAISRMQQPSATSCNGWSRAANLSRLCRALPLPVRLDRFAPVLAVACALWLNDPDLPNSCMETAFKLIFQAA